MRTALRHRVGFGTHDVEGAHHLVRRMLQHVTVPDVAAGIALERDDDASDQARIRLHGIFPAVLVVQGRQLRTGDPQLALPQVEVHVEALAVEDLNRTRCRWMG